MLKHVWSWRDLKCSLIFPFNLRYLSKPSNGFIVFPMYYSTFIENSICLAGRTPLEFCIILKQQGTLQHAETATCFVFTLIGFRTIKEG